MMYHAMGFIRDGHEIALVGQQGTNSPAFMVNLGGGRNLPAINPSILPDCCGFINSMDSQIELAIGMNPEEILPGQVV